MLKIAPNFTLTVIGDVHGKVDKYKKIIDSIDNDSIQVGDFGFNRSHEWFLKNIDYKKHKVNFGNHDDTSFLEHPHSLNHSRLLFNFTLMTVRGADSIDYDHRTEGVDWWRDEQLTYKQAEEVIQRYELYKPKVIISHDCPQVIRENVFNITDKSITSMMLQQMFELHQPEIWIFGHHHISTNIVENKTNFICLKELERLDLNVDFTDHDYFYSYK